MKVNHFTRFAGHSSHPTGVVLALTMFSTLCLGAAERKTLHTGVPDITSHLQSLGPLPADNRLRLAIGLPLRDEPALQRLLRRLYNPASTNFHRFLKPEQFAQRFGPTDQDYESVIRFVTSNRLEVAGTYSNHLVLEVSGKVSDIEKAFQVSLGTYKHPVEERQFYAPDVEPSIDAGLPITYVQGLDNFRIPHPNSLKIIPPEKQPAPNLYNGSGTNGSYAGSDFRNAYVPGVSLAGAGQVVGLVEFTGYTPGDITKYATIHGLSTVPLDNVLVNGVTNTPDRDNVEVAVDIELVLSMAQAIKKVNVYEGIYDSSVMNEIVSPKQGETLPNQVSCSWGIAGDTNIETQLMEMGAQGQSFFYASGDTGAPAGGTDPSPQDDNYMTSVGGTALTMNGVGASYDFESAWQGSYGAVDTALPIPDYQKPVSMAANGGSTTHRNIPDVAMEADFVEVVYTIVFTNGNPPITGHVGTGSGTSAAAPLWATFTALVNEQAASEGKPPMGFINPAIYDIAQGPLYNSCFHDITTGNTTNSSNPTAYFATPGYDLCTGWGSPNGQNLINALVGLAGPVFVDFNYTGAPQNGHYDTPFSTMAQATNGVATYGTIFIKTTGSSSETMTISKPLTITAIDGPGTIGN